MFKTILVPLDGTLVSEGALPYAQALAGRLGAELVLMRAVPGPGFLANPAALPRAISDTEAYLDQFAEDLIARGFNVRTGVPVGGAPASWIADEVLIRDAQLIVMATHARIGPDHWRRGSVAEAVVRATDTPVLLVRATEGLWPMDHFRRAQPSLVVPLDGSSLAEAALPTATQLAAALSAHLVLVGVVPTAHQFIAGEGGAMVSYTPAQQAALLAESQAYLDRIASDLSTRGLHVDVQLRQGEPAAEIAHVALESEAAAVVMATHGRTGLVRSLLGSVAGEVVQRSPSPVLLMRPHLARSAEPGAREAMPSLAGA